MKLFACQACGQTLHFENTRCLKCGRAVGYLPDRATLSAAEPEGSTWRALAAPDQPWRFCENWERSACNWMLPAAGPETLCAACRHNRLIPDLTDPQNHVLWQKMEAAKRRLVYSLLRLGLPLPALADGAPEPLVFDFPADIGDAAAMTGHDNGVITVALAEADDATREARRGAMGEPYRTLLGHFRHEVGHFYWDLLVRDGGWLDGYRAVFGDERADYGEALQRHYAEGPPPDWQSAFVSTYATAHPWEDWAETFAHYLHIVDVLEIAAAFGITVEAEDGDSGIDFDPYRRRRIAPLVQAWIPLSTAINGVNRAMGQADLYPFVLSDPAVKKLGFVQQVVLDGCERAAGTAPMPT